MDDPFVIPLSIQKRLFFFGTAGKESKYRVFSGSFFPVFSPNTGKYGPGKTPYLDSSYSLVQKQFSIAALKDSKTFEKFLDKLLWWISHSVQPVNYQILRVFSQKFSKIFRITFLQITSERQLLLVLTLCLPKVLLRTNFQKSIRRKF